MKIEQLRQIIEISNFGSINRAAQNLYISQSTLSSSLKALEKELGQEIFTRTQTGISATPFGMELIEHSHEILKHVTAIESAAIKNSPNKESLSIAVYYLFFASKLFSRMVNKYANKNILFNYVEDTRSRILEGVANETYELGVLTIPAIRQKEYLELLRNLDLEYVCFTSVVPCAIYGPNCDFYEKDITEFSISQLFNRPIIVFSEDNSFLSSLNEHTINIVRPSNYINVSDRGTLTSLLAQTPHVYIATYATQAYRELPYYPNLKHTFINDANFKIEIGFVKKKNHKLSELATEYIENIKSLLKKTEA